MNEELQSLLDSWQHFHDVPVPLSIELGRTKLTLGEVVDMKENTVIRLSRSTGEGIDIRVGEEPVFRAEIIVIEDRAGVRINEIVNNK